MISHIYAGLCGVLQHIVGVFFSLNKHAIECTLSGENTHHVMWGVAAHNKHAIKCTLSWKSARNWLQKTGCAAPRSIRFCVQNLVCARGMSTTYLKCQRMIQSTIGEALRSVLFFKFLRNHLNPVYSRNQKRNACAHSHFHFPIWYKHIEFDWCCFYYFLRNSLVALLEALFARNTLSLFGTDTHKLANTP